MTNIPYNFQKRNAVKIKVKARDDDGNIAFEGELNKTEASFLLSYAIQDLCNAGVQFYLNEEYPEEMDDEDEQPMRIKWPERSNLN